MRKGRIITSMKCYVFRFLLQTLHYRIRDNGILEILECNFPGGKNRNAERRLSFVIPLPERKRRCCQDPSFPKLLIALLLLPYPFLFLSWCGLLPALLSFCILVFSLLAAVSALFLLTEAVYLFPVFDGQEPFVVRIGWRDTKQSAAFLHELRRTMVRAMREPEQVYNTRAAFLEALAEMRENHLLTETEIQLVMCQYDEDRPFTPLHTYVVLDVLRMDGILSEDEYQEMKYERILHPNQQKESPLCEVLSSTAERKSPEM